MPTPSKRDYPAQCYSDSDTPSIGMDEDEVANTDYLYSIRAPGDWVVSGFYEGERNTYEKAEAWAKKKYGAKFKGSVKVPDGVAMCRWTFLIGRMDG